MFSRMTGGKCVACCKDLKQKIPYDSFLVCRLVEQYSIDVVVLSM